MKLCYAKTEIKRSGDRRSNENKREVCYLRVTDNDGISGFAELAPLSSWGHKSVEEIISSVDSSSPHLLLKRAAQLANYDLQARQSNRSLVARAEEISNHLLLDLASSEIDSKTKLIKVKIGKDLYLETKQLQRLLEQDIQLKVRIDFNGLFKSAETFLAWWRGVDFKEQIDFIEDPVLIEKEWRLINNLAPEVILAADQMLGKVEAKVLVVKPSWEDPEEVLKSYSREDLEIVGTNVLASPLDQAQSIAEVLRIKDNGWSVLSCGLFSVESLFEQRGDKIFVGKNTVGYGVDLSSWELEWQPL